MKVLLICVVIILSGCLHDKDEELNENTDLPSANASGFPDVAGVYSFTTGKIRSSCSDGSSNESPGISLNNVVAQDGNEITLFNLDPNVDEDAAASGFVFKSQTTTKGIVQKNSDFIMSKTALAEFTDFSVEARLRYSINGSFDNDGWHGDYEYTAIFTEMEFSCTFKASFFGDFIRKDP